VLCVFEKDATSSNRQELLIDGSIWILIDTVATYFFTITKSRKRYDIKNKNRLKKETVFIFLYSHVKSRLRSAMFIG
jgi:hypothetical protein